MIHFKCIFTVAILSSLPRVESRKEWVPVHNPKLDIVLLFDASQSMGRVRLGDVRKAMAMWIKNYFATGNKEGETRFAVMSCANAGIQPVRPFRTTVSLHLEDSIKSADPATTIMEHVMSMKHNDSWDNVDGCAETTVDEILIPSRGDRDDADNVVFYVTDCNMYQNDDTHKTAMERLINKVKAFLFICVMKNDDPPGQYVYDDSNYKNMLSWVKDSRRIFNYTDESSIFKKLDGILPGTFMVVEHCEYQRIEKTECKEVENKKCAIITYPIISVHPDTPGRSEPCPRNDSHECTCPNTTTSAQDLSETTTSLPNAGPEALQGNLNRMEQPADSTTFIVVGIIGLLLLLILIVVIVLVVLARRRKKKTLISRKSKRKHDAGLDHKKKGEKSEAIKADLTVVSQNRNQKLMLSVGKSKGPEGKNDKSTIVDDGGKSFVSKKPNAVQNAKGERSSIVAKTRKPAKK